MMIISTGEGLDILGDGHGCLKERIDLLEQAGYIKGEDGLYRHPKGRKLVYLNDEANKGYSKDERILYGEFPSIAMMQIMKQHVEAGLAYAVTSNNNEKICKYLDPSIINTDHLEAMDFAIEMNQFEIKYGAKEREKLGNELYLFCKSLPSYIIVENEQGETSAVITHAGILDDMIGKDSADIRKFCAWGGTAANIKNWVELHKYEFPIIWGHKPQREPKIQNNTINIDTGGYFGNYLTMLRFPEMNFIKQKVETSYETYEDEE
ncbi:hypothetical protein [Bacillus cereus group sp. TH152-1LC]|uniref:hypothetical protein n=1 Tax=Bacillus cereus group sp. TH152-1LC TaxID=3018060 RepID=UPI0022DF8AE7|nr:hypothetical protein [Bacillus cereus group sp. TH152-1LC]MDA1675250.1 hypothetical protein [Bacillus cereus group sp. TH152-1LC]